MGVWRGCGVSGARLEVARRVLGDLRGPIGQHTAREQKEVGEERGRMRMVVGAWRFAGGLGARRIKAGKRNPGRLSSATVLP